MNKSVYAVLCGALKRCFRSTPVLVFFPGRPRLYEVAQKSKKPLTRITSQAALKSSR